MLQVIISEYYYYSGSVLNSTWKFKHLSVYIYNKFIYNNPLFYNGFPSAVWSWYKDDVGSNNLRVYYVCG